MDGKWRTITDTNGVDDVDTNGVDYKFVLAAEERVDMHHPRMSSYARVRALSTNIVAAWSEPIQLVGLAEPDVPWLHATSQTSLVAEWTVPAAHECVVKSYELQLTDETLAAENASNDYSEEVVTEWSTKRNSSLQTAIVDEDELNGNHRHRFDDLKPGHKYSLRLFANAIPTGVLEEDGKGEEEVISSVFSKPATATLPSMKPPEKAKATISETASDSSEADARRAVSRSVEAA